MGDEKHLAEAIGERQRLVAIAYRMLGTTGEAEDAVQETYTRWYRMPEPDRDAIANPQAWLTRVLGRVCLDMLGGARARREHYVGEWLPEPLPAGYFSAGSAAADPLDQVTLDDSVSSALLVVLEALTPPERVAFVLHDVFALPFGEIGRIVGRSAPAVRQLATTARRRIREARDRAVSRTEHNAVVEAFAAACHAGDLAALTRILDPAVELRSDGGGFVSAARRPVYGADRVGRFLLGALAKQPQTEVEILETTDGAAFALRRDGAVTGIVNLNVVDGRVRDVWMMLNPEKLLQWHA